MMKNNTPETNAELAQIHYLMEKCRDWRSPLYQVENLIKDSKLAEAHAELRSHIETMRHLADRLKVQVETLGLDSESETAAA